MIWLLSFSSPSSLTFQIPLLFLLFNMLLHTPPLQFIIILLLFSSAALPTTRSLLSNTEESSIHTTTVEGDWEFRAGERVVDDERRMALEIADYQGTEANNHHDPRTPGRS